MDLVGIVATQCESIAYQSDETKPVNPQPPSSGFPRTTLDMMYWLAHIGCPLISEYAHMSEPEPP